MSGGGSWYVLVEEMGYQGIGDDYGVSTVEHVDGGVARAREVALEIAKKFPEGSRLYTGHSRSVFRIDENSLLVVFKKGHRRASFRVSVGELIHLEEGTA